MSIELEHILAMSVTEYEALVGLDLDQYVMMGVHVSGIGKDERDFIEAVPEGVEVVLDFKQRMNLTAAAAGQGYTSYFKTCYTASGTALISKEKYEALRAPSPIKEQ